MQTHIHPTINGCDWGTCDEQARVVAALAWKTPDLKGTVEIRTLCIRDAQLLKEVWKGSREASVTIFPVAEITQEVTV
jgi:hypothetical protein